MCIATNYMFFHQLGRTPLHYAEIFLEGDDVIDHMIDKGASQEVKDVVCVSHGLNGVMFSRDL